jgi:hypothetical protein
MDDAHSLILSVASSLGRLQLRLLRLSHRQPRSLGLRAATRPQWSLGDLSPPSEWLATTPPHTVLDGVIAAVSLAQAHLLAMLESPEPIDARRACLVVHHISCSGGWSPIMVAPAGRLGVRLASSPLDEARGASLRQAPLAATRRSVESRHLSSGRLTARSAPCDTYIADVCR